MAFNPIRVYRFITFLGLLFVALTLNPVPTGDPDNVLDNYINAPDPTYAYSLPFEEIQGSGYTAYLLTMSSQSWPVTGTVWTHLMAIVVPDNVSTQTGMLILGGGNNMEPPDPGSSEIVVAAKVAVITKSVVTVVAQIPNQPLLFPDEPQGLRKDELVAYTFDKALDTGDWNWPAYLPMTKAAVRAMDTVQDFTLNKVNQFVVVGFSKRGATTWLTAAAAPDKVQAIAPGVFDMLNMDEQIEHHFSAYGFYSKALDDYANYDILRRLRTPEGQDLIKVVDPLVYKDRLTMPKFLLNSTGDRFFTPDSAQFYFDELEGENLIRYVANTGHDLKTKNGSNEDAILSLVSWYIHILTDQPRPEIQWKHSDGHLMVETDQPAFARFWHAYNPVARDFRVESFGPNWNFVPLSATPQTSFVVPVPATVDGWIGYYVDLIYPAPIPGVPPQTYSTPVFISPDTLPFEVSDPLLNPKGINFWKRQFTGAQGKKAKARIPADVLASYFPIPLFDQSVTDMEAAADIFTTLRLNARTKALQHCLALRLNIRDKQIGWYTTVNSDDEGESEKLWALYGEAHKAFLEGEYKQARLMCASINRL